MVFLVRTLSDTWHTTWHTLHPSSVTFNALQWDSTPVWLYFETLRPQVAHSHPLRTCNSPTNVWYLELFLLPVSPIGELKPMWYRDLSDLQEEAPTSTSCPTTQLHTVQATDVQLVLGSLRTCFFELELGSCEFHVSRLANWITTQQRFPALARFRVVL